jgi:general secretion pathway protein J
VAYQYNGEALQRVVWLVLDRAQDTTPRVQTLMTGVTDFKVSLINADGSRQEVITAADGDELPVGIELTITSELWGDLTRRVNLPEYVPFLTAGSAGALESENNLNDVEIDQSDEFDPAAPPLSPSVLDGAL